jgi:alkanesulfonate monooxygenase SsuD/methylene tetrahydromethanopterin reductase-like flavin-dependent oxidoreductase (luciferase family)
MDLEHEVFGLPFPEWSERFDRFAESLPYLRAAFEDGHAKVTGTHYSIDAEVRPRPTGIRLVTGGSGPVRTPTLAGTFADEYNHLSAPIEEIAKRNEVMRRAAAEAGRDPGSIEITVMGQVITAPDRQAFDERLARDAAARDTEPSVLLDKWKKAGIPVGPPDEVAETLAAYERVGINRYYLQWLDLSDREGLDMTWGVVKA